MAIFDPSGPSRFEGAFGLPTTYDQASIIILPVPWEPTTSYRRGTAGGPANIRERSHQVDLFDRDFGCVYEAGLHMVEEPPEWIDWNQQACGLSRPIIDAGGAETPEHEVLLERVNAFSDRLNEAVRARCEAELARGRRVGLVGGDHSTPFGLIDALTRRHPNLGVLHIDAHADLRVAYEGFTHSHASIMFNVHERLPVSSITQVGIRDFSEEEHALSQSSDRITTFFDADIAARLFRGESFETIVRAIIETLPERVYISFDIDGLDPTNCPGTGTPVPGGLSFREATYLVREVARARRVVGFDLNEVNGQGEWDGIVGARILYKLLGALASQR